MAAVKTTVSGLESVKDNALMLLFFQDSLKLSPEAKKLDSLCLGMISSLISSGDFSGEKDQKKVIITNNKNLRNIILFGLGKKDDFELNAYMCSLSNVSKKLRDNGFKSFSIDVSALKYAKQGFDDAIEKTVLGISLGLYKHLKFKTKDLDKVKKIDTVTLVFDSKEALSKAQNSIDFAAIMSEQVIKARNLVNEPPNIATPAYVADYAKNMASKNGIKCIILEEDQLKKLGFGCMLGVAQGSSNHPRLVTLEYWGKGKNEKPIVLVGKGVTFDTGGLNLKPYVGSAATMTNMKDDKAGAVSVIHAVEAAARLKLKVNVVGVLPLVENMPSGKSYRPDDVLKSYSGLTVEIKNTDAEGRLILADALAYADKTYNPKAMIDLATLTGAAIVVLGNNAAPFMGTDKALVEKIRNASEKSLEKTWELPLWKEYDELIKSDIADLKNVADSGEAGTIIGGTFLKNFVSKETPWCHIDIAGPSWSNAENGISQKGATGFSIRMLVEILRSSR